MTGVRYAEFDEPCVTLIRDTHKRETDRGLWPRPVTAAQRRGGALHILKMSARRTRPQIAPGAMWRAGGLPQSLTGPACGTSHRQCPCRTPSFVEFAWQPSVPQRVARVVLGLSWRPEWVFSVAEPSIRRSYATATPGCPRKASMRSLLASTSPSPSSTSRRR